MRPFRELAMIQDIITSLPVDRITMNCDDLKADKDIIEITLQHICTPFKAKVAISSSTYSITVYRIEYLTEDGVPKEWQHYVDEGIAVREQGFGKMHLVFKVMTAAGPIADMDGLKTNLTRAADIIRMYPLTF